MCKYKERCPSATGWCKSKETVTDECMEFILNAIDNKEKEIKGLKECSDWCGWIEFTSYYDEDSECLMLNCETPEDCEEILVTNGVSVWYDVFFNDIDGATLESDCEIEEEVTHWMRYPNQPQKKEVR